MTRMFGTLRPSRNVSKGIGRDAVGGFTLVELMVVLAILAIGAAVAAPSVGGMIQNYRVDAVVRQMMTDMQSARMTAVSQKTFCRVIVEVANNRYRMERLDPDGTWNQVGVPRAIGTQDTPYFAQGVTLGAISGANDLTVTFDRLGMATPSDAAANGTTSATASSGGRVRTLFVTQAGGMRIG